MVKNYCGCSRRRCPKPQRPQQKQCCGRIVINNNLINGPGVVNRGQGL